MPMADPKRMQERLSHMNWGLLGGQGHVLGIDLGGYGLRVALINLHDQTYSSTSVEATGDDPQVILETALALARKHLDDMGVPPNLLVRVGVGFGGPVDPSRGVVLFSPRMTGWKNFSLKNYFEQAFDTVTLVDNDANLIALGEAVFGIGYECQHLFYLHLSSGVGGGIVLDGRIYHGAMAMAGEIGHAVVGPVRGGVSETATLEELVSISGLLKRAEELGLTTTNLNDIFSEHPIGQRVVQEAVQTLAIRIAHVVALLDPRIVVLGGIVVRLGGDSFVQSIADNMNQYLAPALSRPVSVVASELGADSIAIGALALALDSLRD